MKLVCVDAVFLIGVYDDRDQHHTRAQAHFLEIFDNGKSCMLVPWPILYETVSTRLVRNRSAMVHLQNDWRKLSHDRRLQLVADEKYRENVVEDCFEELAKSPYRTLSATDRVIRNVLADRGRPIDALLTYNQRDFVDVCRRYNRHLVT